jgi:hypothetical protein
LFSKSQVGVGWSGQLSAVSNLDQCLGRRRDAYIRFPGMGADCVLCVYPHRYTYLKSQIEALTRKALN